MSNLPLCLSYTGTKYCELAPVEYSPPYRIWLYDESVWSSQLIINGGGSGTTDWVEGGYSGLGNYWSTPGSYYITPTIVTGGGFSGNAQRITTTGITGVFYFEQIRSYVPPGTYNIRWNLKYRTSYSGLTALRVRIGVDGYGWNIWTLPSNTGTAISSGTYDYSSYFSPTGINHFRIDGHSNNVAGEWFEVDEINMYYQ